MIPSIKTLSLHSVKNLLGIFFDIDDTFTTHGKIPATAFQALWELKKTGIKAVAITGRPGGWCDHIARMWPVDGVVGEKRMGPFISGSMKKRENSKSVSLITKMFELISSNA